MKQSSSSPQTPLETNKSIYGEESLSLKDFALGTIVGAVIGASLALLYAPKKGSEFRQDVATQATTIKEKSVELSETAKDKTVQISKDLKEQSVQLVDKVKQKASNATEELEEIAQGDNTLDEVASAVEETVAELTNLDSKKADATIEDINENPKA